MTKGTNFTYHALSYYLLDIQNLHRLMRIDHWRRGRLLAPSPSARTHAIIFSMFPSSSNLTVMVQQGLRLDLPSGPGCSLKYLPCSHFNPHLNTSSILGHYRESVCPACLSLRLVCVCVIVYTAAQSEQIPLYPGVT